MELNKYRDQSELVKLLESIIDSSYDGLWISDHEGEVIRVNRASEKINDIKSDQVLGKKMEDLVREGLFDRSVTLKVLKARKAITMIQKLKNRKQVLATGNPVFNDQGEIILVFVKDRDITELNKLRYEAPAGSGKTGWRSYIICPPFFSRMLFLALTS
jgi:PAS domain S-box-containing protein